MATEINEKPSPKIPTSFFSLGHRCTSSGILKYLKLKTESYPFDWIVSNLSTIRHCIETDFVDFLEPANYVKQKSFTGNILDTRTIVITEETCEKNIIYEALEHSHIGIRKSENDKPNTYWLPLAITHHSMLAEGDVEYFQRCVARFRDRMISGKHGGIDAKRYLYIHPYIGVYEYDYYKHALKKEWVNFSEYIGGKMGNIRGMFIVPVFLNKGLENKEIVWEKLFRTEKAVGWKVEISNWAFTDGGETFSGQYENELRSFEAMVRKEFWDDIPDKKIREDLDSVSLVFSEKGK